jgi:putative membrane protein insertion efficiency factor
MKRLPAGLARACDRAAGAVLIGLVILYKATLSPLLGRHCRFTPSCSSYFRQAVEKHGALRGGLKGLARIGRCHPWHPGGHDPP